jgi:DNA polymerase III alpha subunit
MGMIPLFKSQFSVGRSILSPKKNLDIAQINSLERVVLVEDSFYGFRVFNNLFQEAGMPFVFGIRLSVVDSSSDESEKPSKLVFFAKNNDGLKKTKSLFSDANTNDLGALVLSDYSKDDLKDVEVAVPFYDSFIFNNLFHFGLSHLNVDRLNPTYFLEDNDHPFDFQIRSAVEGLNAKTQEVKTILYHNKQDFHAFQMYKATCSRSQGRKPTFQKPNLNHFCSDNFSWESYKDATV